MDSNSGWAWFGDPVVGVGKPPEPDGIQMDLARAFARAFRGRDGEKVLGHLRAITLDRAMGPSATDALLRHVEGQRQLVTYVTALVDRGRDGPAT